MHSTPKRRVTHDVDRNGLKRELQNLSFPVSPGFLWEPTAGDAQSFYQAVVDYISDTRTATTRRDVSELEGHGLDLLSDLGNCHLVFSRLFLVRQCQRALEALSAEEFCIADIAHPDPGRLINFCSAIVQFCHFKEEHVRRLQERKQEAEVHKRRAEELAEKLQSLKAEAAELDAETDQYEAEAIDLGRRHETARRHVLSLRQQFDEHTCALRKANDEAERLTNQISNTDSKIQEASEHVDDLEREVVRSPGRLKRALDELLCMTEKDELQLRASNRQRTSVRKRLETIHGVGRRLEQAQDVLSRLKSQFDKSVVQFRNFSQAEQRMLSARERLRQAYEQLQETQKELQTTHRKKSNTQDAFSKQYDETRVNAEEARQKLEERRESFTTERECAESLEKDAKEIEEEIRLLETARETALEKCTFLRKRLSAIAASICGLLKDDAREVRIHGGGSFKTQRELEEIVGWGSETESTWICERASRELLVDDGDRCSVSGALPKQTIDAATTDENRRPVTQ